MKNKQIIAIVIAIAVMLTAIAFAWNKLDKKLKEEPPVDLSALATESTSWSNLQNEHYGINFKHPIGLDFTGSQIAIIGKMLYAISAKDENNNGYYIIILNKALTEKDIDREIALGKNEHVGKELSLPAGKLLMSDGTNADNKYFIQGYLKGSENIYQFKLVTTGYSQESLDLFKKIVTTVEISK